MMNTQKRKIFFRADANRTIGFGHFVRTLAFIDIIKDEYDCFCIIRNPTQNIISKITEKEVEYCSLPTIPNIIDEANYLVDNYFDNNSVVVLDGYEFDTNYQKIIKEKVYRLICIDDVHPYHFVADAIINQIEINTDVYSIENYTKLFTGFKYSLLRDPFLRASQIELRSFNNKFLSIFICFGGSDLFNYTSLALKSCLKVDKIHEIHIVLGGSFEHRIELQKVINGQTNKVIFTYYDIIDVKIVELLTKCDIAIVPASSILIECIACGVSFVTGFYVSNQQEFIRFIIQSGLSEDIVDFKNIEIDVFSEMISKHNIHNQIVKISQFRDQIKSAKHNLKVMMNNIIGKASPLIINYSRGEFIFKSFIKLNELEMEFVLKWRNHYEVRKWMFNKNIIAEKDHINFINGLHQKNDKAYWLVYKKENPIAVVNLINYTSDDCEWGIYIRPDMIGTGLGLDIQYYFLNILFSEININSLIAFVNTVNIEVLKILELFDFQKQEGVEHIENEPYFKLILTKRNWVTIEKDIKSFKINRLLKRNRSNSKKGY